MLIYTYIADGDFFRSKETETLHQEKTCHWQLLDKNKMTKYLLKFIKWTTTQVCGTNHSPTEIKSRHSYPTFLDFPAPRGHLASQVLFVVACASKGIKQICSRTCIITGHVTCEL